MKTHYDEREEIIQATSNEVSNYSKKELEESFIILLEIISESLSNLKGLNMSEVSCEGCVYEYQEAIRLLEEVFLTREDKS